MNGEINKMSDYKYKIRYTFKADSGQFTVNDITDEGLADDLLLVSILTPPDGSYSQAIVSHKGNENRSLTQKEIFKAWLMMGVSLHDQGELEGWQKQFAEMHTSMIRNIFSHKDDCELQKGKKK